jgi:hypothetical protein
MRFSQLPVGQRFEFEGIRYVKTGPMIGAEEAGGKTRFIARYALVQPLGGEHAVPQPAATTPQSVDAAAVAAASEDFYRQARAIVETLGAEADAATFSRARSDLDATRAAFRAALARLNS